MFELLFLLFFYRTSTVVDKIKFPSPGLADIDFCGPHFDQVFVSAARLIVNPYGGEVVENRSTDAALFRVKGLDVRGYDSPRVRLDSMNCPNKNCCGKF